MIQSLRNDLSGTSLALYHQVRRLPQRERDELFFHLTRMLGIADQAIKLAERKRPQASSIHSHHRPRPSLN